MTLEQASAFGRLATVWDSRAGIQTSKRRRRRCYRIAADYAEEAVLAAQDLKVRHLYMVTSVLLSLDAGEITAATERAERFGTLTPSTVVQEWLRELVADKAKGTYAIG